MRLRGLWKSESRKLRFLGQLTVFVIALEGLCRLHHGLMYQVWQPIGPGAVYYFPVSQKLSHSWQLQARKAGPECGEIYFSGGSVAAGYGVSGPSPAEFISEALSETVVDLSAPGLLFQEEFERVQARIKECPNPPKFWISLSGFNDWSGQEMVRRIQSCNQKFPGTRISLLLLKIRSRFCKATQKETIWQIPPWERFGGKSFLFLQPQKSPDLKDSRQRYQLELKLRGWNFEDLQGVSQEDWFVDECHLTSQAQKILAEEMAQRIRPHL